MAHYIDKDALVAEIERLAEVGRVNVSIFDGSRKEKAVWLQQADVCDRILSFINTLEVKEVDLEKEIDEYFKEWRDYQGIDSSVTTNYGDCATLDDIKEVCRHFFALGLKAKQ